MSTGNIQLPTMTDCRAPIYLDYNATTPIDDRVFEVVRHFMEVEFGNSGSRTHHYGQEAAKALKHARDQVAKVVNCGAEEVVFTSGATEANNIALLGLKNYGERHNKKHLISTEIEHSAVLEPLSELKRQGFELELVKPRTDGRIEPEDIRKRVRGDTLLVSCMQVNNETGIIQPIERLVELLKHEDVVLHVDAAQGFGKHLKNLDNPSIDFIAVSGHKIGAPKGIGALIVRRGRRANRKLSPIMWGGGQERGLRPGNGACRPRSRDG